MAGRAFRSTAADGWDLVRRYDSMMYDREQVEYFGHSDFTNFGYWDPDTDTQQRACDNLMEHLLSFLPQRRGTILDVACGRGGTTRFLLRSHAPSEITAINISAKQLETARRNARACTFIQMNATRLEFEDGFFDNVICVEAAFHFNTRERFFREALRVLKRGGRLVLSDILMTWEAEQARPYRLEENYLSGPDAYRDLAERVGFIEVEVIDATKPCWEACYWHAVRYIHERYLRGEIDLAGLEDFLRLTHRRAEDIRYYLLASLRKGG